MKLPPRAEPQIETALKRAQRRLTGRSFLRSALPMGATALAGTSACLLRQQFSPIPDFDLIGFLMGVGLFALGLALTLTLAGLPSRRDAARDLDRWAGTPGLAVTYVDFAADATPSELEPLFRQQVHAEAARLRASKDPNPLPTFALRFLVPLIAVNALLAVMPPAPGTDAASLRAVRATLERARREEDRELRAVGDALAEAKSPDEIARKTRALWNQLETAAKKNETSSPDTPTPADQEEHRDAPAPRLARALRKGDASAARRAAEDFAQDAASAEELRRRLSSAAKRASLSDQKELSALAQTLSPSSPATSDGSFGLAARASARAEENLRRNLRQERSRERVRTLLLRVLDDLGESEDSDDSGATDAPLGGDGSTGDLSAPERRRRQLDRLPASLRDAGRDFLERRAARRR